MKKFGLVLPIILFVLLGFSLVSFVGASSVMWSQTYGGEGEEVAHWLVETSDGGYAIAGYTGGIGDFWLVKTDVNGNMEWNQRYEPIKYDRVGSFVETSDGGFAIAGGSSNFWLIKTDENGDLQWKQTYGAFVSGGRAYSLVETLDGGYALAGETWTIGEGSTDVWLIKTDMYGNFEWNGTYGSAGGDSANSLTVTSDGGFALAGSVWSTNSSSYDFWLIKTDTNGVMQWNQTYDYNKWWEDANFVVETSDGGYVIAGIAAFPPPLPVSYFWLIKTDAYGNMEWSKTYGETEYEKANSIVMTSDGGFAIAGFKSTSFTGSKDFWLVKTDANGNIEWSQTHGGSESDIAHSLVETSDGGYALAGETYSLGAGDSDFWLVKTNEHGLIPEFPSWTILPLFLIASLFAIVIKKRAYHPNHKS